MTDVMIVDDSHIDLEIIDRALTKAGFQVYALDETEDVLETAVALQPDFIILDIFMPNQSGLEICQHLKSDDRTRGIPVMFLSAHKDLDHVMQSIHLGCIDYIQKPVSMEKLVEVVKRHDVLKQIRDSWKPARQELQRIIQKYS